MSISYLFQTLHVYLFVEKIFSVSFLTTIVFPSILALCTYQRKSALGCDEEEKVELFLNGCNNQHIKVNAENCKGEILAQLQKKNMIYQGMYEHHYTKLFTNLTI